MSLKKILRTALPVLLATGVSSSVQALSCGVGERVVGVEYNGAVRADDLLRIPIYDEVNGDEVFLTLGGVGDLTQIIFSPLEQVNGVSQYDNIFVEYPSGVVTGGAETVSVGPDGRWQGNICLQDGVPDFLGYGVYTDGSVVKGVNTGVGYVRDGSAVVVTTRSTENKFKGWNEGREQSGSARTQRFISGETGIYPVIVPREDVERFTGAIAPLYVQKDLEGMLPATNDSHVDVVGTTIHKENKDLGEEYRLCFSEKIQGFFLKTGGDRVQADNCATIPETYVGECTFYVDDLEKNCSIRDDRILNDGRTIDDVVVGSSGFYMIGYDFDSPNLRTDITALGETQTFTEHDFIYSGPNAMTTIEAYVLDGQGERLYTLTKVFDGPENDPSYIITLQFSTYDVNRPTDEKTIPVATSATPEMIAHLTGFDTFEDFLPQDFSPGQLFRQRYEECFTLSSTDIDIHSINVKYQSLTQEQKELFWTNNFPVDIPETTIEEKEEYLNDSAGDGLTCGDNEIVVDGKEITKYTINVLYNDF